MISGLFEWLAQGLRLGVAGPALRRALRPLEPPLSALCVDAPLSGLLRAQGVTVPAPGTPDVVLGGAAPGELDAALRGYAERVCPGGRVVLVTRRGRFPLTRLCAAFLHAGLGDLWQETAGLLVLTAGTVRPPLPSGDALAALAILDDRQKTCEETPGVRSQQGAP